MVAMEPPDKSDGVPQAATRVRPARIFVALRIAPAVALALARYSRGLEQFSVRAVAPDDIHLTLVPPWNEASIPRAVEKLRHAAGQSLAFTLVLRHIGYGLDRRRPRFLWADCAASEELANLRMALLHVFQQEDARPFRPHVTLARLRDKGRLVARKHPLDQDIALTQRIETVELMQSPPPGHHGYKVLASPMLGENPETASRA
jgi:2'-5' RNA ligase